MAPPTPISAISPLLLLFFTSWASAYTNHTVGGPSGWFFNSTTKSPSADFTKWASAQSSFNLGDYLIFNTNSNQSVIQTYNATTYKLCNADDDASNGDIFIYDNSTANGSLTFAVPLTKEGPNYFFDDGVECEKGMAFQISVKHGKGLPPNLNQPPPPAYVESPPPLDPPPYLVPDSQDASPAGNGVGGANMGLVVFGLVLVSRLMV
ncbi:hypothetical protein GIB67_000172 [Kingdonia uniflora]|uniref:Phytocyanin domain-containing protein n=1 Tax=Kingdonia uniflora TaxID=39325 RepID=A0A7J7PA66_9MAGN|nr:hypothetical protein GIB67_000172 [Kingdonia uniflora]